jgi:hypothetical protein
VIATGKRIPWHWFGNDPVRPSDDDPPESVTRPRTVASEGRSEQRHPDQGADK